MITCLFHSQIQKFGRGHLHSTYNREKWVKKWNIKSTSFDEAFLHIHLLLLICPLITNFACLHLVKPLFNSSLSVSLSQGKAHDFSVLCIYDIQRVLLCIYRQHCRLPIHE